MDQRAEGVAEHRMIVQHDQRKVICENCEALRTVTFQKKGKDLVGVCDTCGEDCVIAYRSDRYIYSSEKTS